MAERQRRKRKTSQGRTLSMEEVVFGYRVTAEDGKVEVCIGGGCLSLFGMFFLLFGSGVMVFVIRTVSDASTLGTFVTASAVFALIGAVLVFGRYRLKIDAHSRTYRRGCSLLVFFVTKRGSLDEFDEVTLTHEVLVDRVSSGHRVRTYYPIQLSGPQGALSIASRSSLSQGRSEAKKVAKALNLPLSDRADDEPSEAS